jgi:hypothetical protein
MVGPQPAKSDAPLSSNLIRPPPVDDVNNLRHDGKSRRCLASTAIQIRQNALFRSPEYAASETDLYFTPAGIQSNAEHIPGSRIHIIPSLWVTCPEPVSTGRGRAFIEDEINSLLSA